MDQEGILLILQYLPIFNFFDFVESGKCIQHCCIPLCEKENEREKDRERAHEKE